MSRKTKASPTKRRPRTDKAMAVQMLRRLREGEDVRSRKARRLRAAIRVDRYENELKWQIAVDRLAREIA